MLSKRKREQHIVTRMSLVFLVVLVGLGLTVLMMMLNTTDDENPNFLPTAHSLEQSPLDAPAFIRVNANCVGESDHCFRLQAEPLVGRGDGFVFGDMAQRLPSLTLMIDGNAILSGGFVMGSEIYGDVAVATLNEGLHLAELSITDNDGNVHHHAWAFRIGSAAGAAVPTLAIPPTHATPTP